MEKKKVRNGKVDLLKFIFSIVVILYHFGNSVKYDRELFNRGYMAVEFFFLVSGFLFAASLSRVKYSEETLAADSTAFIVKKYRSFMPYHLFMVAVTFGCLFFSRDWSVRDLFLNLVNSIPDILLIQMGLTKQFSTLGHEWYISAMLIVMFILTPIVIKYKDKFTRLAAPVASLLVLGWLWRKYEGNLDLVFSDTGFAYAGLLRAFAEICLGCFCYVICNSGVLEKINSYALIAFETAVYAFLLLYADNRFSDISPYVAVILIACAVTVSFSDKASLSFLNNGFVYFLGKISFPIYLMQIIVRQYISQIDWKYGYASHAIFYVAVVILSSVVCILVMDNVMKFIDNKKRSKKKR